VTGELDAVAAGLDTRGYDLTRPEDAGEPAAVATPRVDARPLLDHRPVDRRPVAVERGTRDPTTVLHRVAGAARDGRLCLFVAAPETAAAIREILTGGGVREERNGCRAFYDVPDRVSCSDGSLGACRTDAELIWREEAIGGRLRLVLFDGDHRAAVLEGIGALTDAGPDPAVFPYTYRRGSDKRLHVTDRSGREVGVFNTVRAMKGEAYRPVAEPLIPEHVFRASTRLSDAWAIAVVVDDAVSDVLTA